jgi:hypothetical protein
LDRDAEDSLFLGAAWTKDRAIIVLWKPAVVVISLYKGIAFCAGYPISTLACLTEDEGRFVVTPPFEVSMPQAPRGEVFLCNKDFSVVGAISCALYFGYRGFVGG